MQRTPLPASTPPSPAASASAAGAASRVALTSHPFSPRLPTRAFDARVRPALVLVSWRSAAQGEIDVYDKAATDEALAHAEAAETIAIDTGGGEHARELPSGSCSEGEGDGDGCGGEVSAKTVAVATVSAARGETSGADAPRSADPGGVADVLSMVAAARAAVAAAGTEAAEAVVEVETSRVTRTADDARLEEGLRRAQREREGERAQRQNRERVRAQESARARERASEASVVRAASRWEALARAAARARVQAAAVAAVAAEAREATAGRAEGDESGTGRGRTSHRAPREAQRKRRRAPKVATAAKKAAQDAVETPGAAPSATGALESDTSHTGESASAAGARVGLEREIECEIGCEAPIREPENQPASTTDDIEQASCAHGEARMEELTLLEQQELRRSREYERQQLHSAVGEGGETSEWLPAKGSRASRARRTREAKCDAERAARETKRRARADDARRRKAEAAPAAVWSQTEVQHGAQQAKAHVQELREHPQRQRRCALAPQPPHAARSEEVAASPATAPKEGERLTRRQQRKKAQLERQERAQKRKQDQKSADGRTHAQAEGAKPLVGTTDNTGGVDAGVPPTAVAAALSAAKSAGAQPHASTKAQRVTGDAAKPLPQPRSQPTTYHYASPLNARRAALRAGSRAGARPGSSARAASFSALVDFLELLPREALVELLDLRGDVSVPTVRALSELRHHRQRASGGGGGMSFGSMVVGYAAGGNALLDLVASAEAGAASRVSASALVAALLAASEGEFACAGTSERATEFEAALLGGSHREHLAAPNLEAVLCLAIEARVRHACCALYDAEVAVRIGGEIGEMGAGGHRSGESGPVAEAPTAQHVSPAVARIGTPFRRASSYPTAAGSSSSSSDDAASDGGTSQSASDADEDRSVGGALVARARVHTRETIAAERACALAEVTSSPNGNAHTSAPSIANSFDNAQGSAIRHARRGDGKTTGQKRAQQLPAAAQEAAARRAERVNGDAAPSLAATFLARLELDCAAASKVAEASAAGAFDYACAAAWMAERWEAQAGESSVV